MSNKSGLVARRPRFLTSWLAFVVILQITAATAAQSLSLFDGHIHYSVGSPQAYPPAEVIRILDAAGIRRALLSSTPNDGTRELYRLYPERFVPSLRPYRKTRDLSTWAQERASWYRDPETSAFLRQELQRGIYRAIGEFHLDGDEADSPVIRDLVHLAVERRLPLHAHSDHIAVEKMFAMHHQVRILWAHAGMSEPPEVIARMLARYPALHAELSYRQVSGNDGRILPEWRALFITFPDRFATGSDTWIPPRWGEVETLAQSTRAWLKTLPADIAEQIAWRNLERFLAPR